MTKPTKPMSARTIAVPTVRWALGTPEQSTMSGVTVTTRPIYYFPTGADQPVRVGEVKRDYAAPLIAALLKAGQR